MRVTQNRDDGYAIRRALDRLYGSEIESQREQALAALDRLEERVVELEAALAHVWKIAAVEPDDKEQRCCQVLTSEDLDQIREALLRLGFLEVHRGHNRKTADAALALLDRLLADSNWCKRP